MTNPQFARLAARAVFVSSFFLQKQLMYDFLAGNNYPNSPHSQGGMKFATQFHLYLIFNRLPPEFLTVSGP